MHGIKLTIVLKNSQGGMALLPSPPVAALEKSLSLCSACGRNRKKVIARNMRIMFLYRIEVVKPYVRHYGL